MDIVERLEERIIADAFEQRRIVDGALCERLMDERSDAAETIKSLRLALANETEECARVAEALSETYSGSEKRKAEAIATAIRSRKDKGE